MEQLYLAEYNKVYTKDKSGNKDLNFLAIEELKRAQYFFEYVRTSQKLYQLEERKSKKEKDELTKEQIKNTEFIQTKDQVLAASKSK